MFKTISHGLQFKLKRPSHWTCCERKSKKSLSKMSILLVSTRKTSVLESLYVFITNLQDFLAELQLILFA